MNLFFALVMIARTLNIANSCDGFCDSNNGQYDYTSSTVEYQGSYKKTGYDNVCCYEYLVTDKTSGNDCNGESLKELSHWTLQAYCDEGDMSVFSGTNEPIQIDDTTCATEKGIKIDRGCSNSDGCLETFCLTFPNNVDECCVMDGWFRTKAGLVIAESSVAVPDCSCPTPAPTKSPSTNPSEDPTVSPSKSPSEDPTVSPTKSPSKNPTKSPTKDPSVTPTVSPTKSPTKDPSVSPSRNPTPSPSAFCQPIIDIQLNDGCDDLEFDAADPDTEVQYTFSRYSLAAKPNGATTPEGTTEGSLSRKAFDHACGDDYSAAHGFAGPIINNDHKMVSVDTKPKQPLIWYRHDYVQTGLVMYSVAITVGILGYILGSRFHVKAAQHVQFDVIDDEADKML